MKVRKAEQERDWLIDWFYCVKQASGQMMKKIGHGKIYTKLENKI